MRSVKKENGARRLKHGRITIGPLDNLGHASLFAGTAIFGNKRSLYTCCIHHDTLNDFTLTPQLL